MANLYNDPQPIPGQSRLGDINLDQHLSRVSESQRQLLRMASEIKGQQTQFAPRDVETAARLYQQTQRNYDLAGNSMAQDIVAGRLDLSPLTQNALALARSSQEQFGDQYAHMKGERSLVVGTVLLIQLVDRFMDQTSRMADFMHRQQLASAVSQRFQLPTWEQVQPFVTSPPPWSMQPARSLTSPGYAQ